MSQEDNESMMPFYSAIECYEELEALFHRESIDIKIIKRRMQDCYRKIEDILIAEDHGPFWVHLFQLKQHMLELLKVLEMKQSIPLTHNKPSGSSSESTSKEMKELLNMVESTIETPRIQGFKQVAGLWEIKKILKSLIILPKYQPQLFEKRKALNSVLLFGPPGTGKTQLVHALAYEAEANLFCITAGNIMSPLVGQTEKNIKFLFDYIKRAEIFSVLFIDEVDGFCRKRSGSEQEHSRRIKTELLCQINEMEAKSNCFLICATNCPWDLDTAFLRRFQKRIYIPLPDFAERADLFKSFTKDTPLEGLEATFTLWDDFVDRTEGCSGSDIYNLVQETLNIPLVELQDTVIWKHCSDGFYEPVTSEDFSLEDIVCSKLEGLPPCSIRARRVEPKDLLKTFEHINLTVKNTEIRKYEEFCKA